MPTNSCQRASTSPRRRVPSAEAWSISLIAALVGLVGLARAAAPASRAARGRRRPPSRSASRACGSRPPRVCRTTPCARLGVGRQRPEPSADLANGARRQQTDLVDLALRHDEQRGVPQAACAEHPGEVRADLLMAEGCVRSSTIATAALRSAACFRNSHGTWSAYRAAEVTNSQRSAAPSSCAASVRFCSSTESMSGASSTASPGGIASDAHQLQRAGVGGGSGGALAGRAGSGPCRTTRRQRGLKTSTGERVVGRSTPGSVTRSPTRELTRVDLPAPVEPPTTVSSGASIWIRRGST